MAQQIVDATHAGIRLVGFSLAGEESFVAAPDLNVCFDIGRAPREIISIDHVLLTHGHMDHSAGVAYYFAQRMFVDNAPGQLYAPEALVGPIQRLLSVWADIDGHEPTAVIRAAWPDQMFEIRRGLAVRPFRVNHACRRHDGVMVEALGYSVVDVRQKLKAEFNGWDAARLVEAKKRGVEITERVEMPLITYCGDTAAGDFLGLEHVRRAKVLVLECTFIEPDHRSRARAGKHLHIDDLREIVPELQNERIVLTHLSRRTALSDAKRQLVKTVRPSDIDRITFLMDAPRRRPRVVEGRASETGGRASETGGGASESGG